MPMNEAQVSVAGASTEGIVVNSEAQDIGNSPYFVLKCNRTSLQSSNYSQQ